MAGALAAMPPYDRYVSVNSIGEGRSITSGLVVERHGDEVPIECDVEPSFLALLLLTCLLTSPFRQSMTSSRRTAQSQPLVAWTLYLRNF